MPTSLKTITEIQNVYKTYSFVIFGAEKVGKTNIVTRFVKDQFTEAHNMTLEGQQNSLMNIDNRRFKIIVYDTAGQENLISMKAFWRSSKDGFVFVYAINNKQSFKDMIEDIIDIKSNPVYKNIPTIVVGNKIDLKGQREVQLKWAEQELKRFQLKVFQISAKTSSREDIQKIFVQLIQMNEISMFSSNRSVHRSQKRWLEWIPCLQKQGQEDKCKLI